MGASEVTKKRSSEKGQAIILLALVFIALIAFVGIVVDVGTVLLRYAQLRRAADSAAVQASNQFREFRPVYSASGGDMYSAAAQVFFTQGFDPAQMHLSACVNGSLVQSPAVAGLVLDTGQLTTQLCTTPPRKLVRIDARIEVGLPFLSIIGWSKVVLQNTSTGEAAAIDLAIVLDRSASMSSESGVTSDTCAPSNSCEPFNTVRSNAVALVNKLYFPYDQVAIFGFDRVARVFDPTTGIYTFTPSIKVTNTLLISDKSVVLDALNNYFSIELQSQCPPISSQTISVTNVPAGTCEDTNIGGAIRAATTVLAVQARTRGAVWMMLLLTDGAPNATNPTSTFADGFCPPTTWRYNETYTLTGYLAGTPAQSPYGYPFCRRVNTGSYSSISRVCFRPPSSTAKCGPGTTITDTLGYQYDAADFARDQADYMSSNGIVAFVIGLGPQVASATNQSTYDGSLREPNSGERMLRYISDVGSQPNDWLCHSNYWKSPTPSELTTGQQCGNYWYAASGAGLQAVFEAIASRIFTRLTQ